MVEQGQLPQFLEIRRGNHLGLEGVGGEGQLGAGGQVVKLTLAEPLKPGQALTIGIKDVKGEDGQAANAGKVYQPGCGALDL